MIVTPFKLSDNKRVGAPVSGLSPCHNPAQDGNAPFSGCTSTDFLRLSTGRTNNPQLFTQPKLLQSNAFLYLSTEKCSPYYYYYFSLLNKAVVVLGAVDMLTDQQKPNCGHDLIKKKPVQNVVDNLQMLWITCAKSFASLLLISLFSVSRAQAAEILIDMRAIAAIESTHNPKARHTDTDGQMSRGLYQIRPDTLKDWNDAHPREKVKAGDLYNAELNRRIAHWYLTKRIPQMLRAYRKPVTLRNVIISYNAGIKYVRTGRAIPHKTKTYLKKYERLAA